MSSNNTIHKCPIKSSVGISNKQYYNHIVKLSENQLYNKKINKFTIDFTLPDKSLINIGRPLIPTQNNPDKFVFVLETTLQAFTDYIPIPDIHTFYKDIFGGNCNYNQNTKKITNYEPRLRFKFYNDGKLVYCTLNNYYNKNESYGSHEPLLRNTAFMNIVKLAPQIIEEKYKLDKTLLQNILDNIITLFNVNGSYRNNIATLLILLMSQESLAVLSHLIIKLFNLYYILSNQLSNTIYKLGTKYIIKQQNLIKGVMPINNKLPEYKNFSITYIVDEQDSRVIIKIELIDIDGLIKSYPNFPEANNINPMLNNNSIMPVVQKNQINFVSY